MKQHPLSAAFPAMQSDDFEALKDSITNIGVQNPITLYEGMVLDGWHRWSAAEAVGVQCPTVELMDVDPRDFVIAQNKARRHVSQAQLAMAVTAVHAWKPTGNPKFVQSHTQCAIGKTNTELAEIAGVHKNTITQAKAVQSKGTAAVQDAVKRGEIGLPKAAKIAQLPQEEQAAAIKKPAPKKEPEEIEYTGPSQSEIDEAMAGAEQDMESLLKLLESDDLAAALKAENDQLRAELAVVKISRDGYMNRSNELIARIKTLKRKLEKATANV